MSSTKRRSLFPVLTRERLDNPLSLGFNAMSPGRGSPLASLGVILAARRATGVPRGAPTPSWPRFRLDTQESKSVSGPDSWQFGGRNSATCAPATSAPGSRSSGPRRNHHWISRYTEAEPLWKAQDISTFCPSVAVTFRGNSVNFAAKHKRTLLEYALHS